MRTSAGVVRFLLASLLATLSFVPGAVRAQSSVKPYFLVIVDTSGSMVASTGAGNNSCGHPRNRMNDAKCVLSRVVNGFGDVSFGLERYTQGGFSSYGPSGGYATCSVGACDGTHDTTNISGYVGPNTDCACNNNYDCGSGAGSGEMLVGIGPDSQSEILRWIDYSCASCNMAPGAANGELLSWGGTPLGGSLLRARNYFQNGTAGFPSPLVGDAPGTCRPVNVILLTDGEESCGGNASTAATQLRSTAVDGRTYDIRTHVIAFGVPNPTTSINSIATAGGTTAFYAADETSLALAFSQIVAASIRYEVCDQADNDCDTRVDEGFPLYCNRPTPGSPNPQNLCAPPAETACDGFDNNCNGQIDEGLRNACGQCGATPAEVCNRADDDCDGAIDEGTCGGCTPSPEICDGLDNDCNGVIDNITRACGTDIGECTAGMQTCTAGTWGACSGIVATTEICNNRDDDCDGVIDGMTRSCGTDVGECNLGTQQCAIGSWGTCIGQISSMPEICDGLDNDCNGVNDNGNPGGGGACGPSQGACDPGSLTCTGGILVCTGGTGPGTEVCNATDDDCDGSIDEGNPGGGAQCGATDVGECTYGMLACNRTTGMVTCQGYRGPTPELCNLLDDDCDGMTDEGDPEAGEPCGMDTGECEIGTTRCLSGTLTCEGRVDPMPEMCNGKDDDCDGFVDDGVEVGLPCGSDVGECSPGQTVCDTVTGLPRCDNAIGPTDEVCDLLDNDCDNAVDEALADGEACGSDDGVCMAGVLRCVDGNPVCEGAVPGGIEGCDCEDNDCDGEVDEDPTTGSLCPSGSECVECSCSRPCVQLEFGEVYCPDGREPHVEDGECFCVQDRCDDAECGGTTIDGTAGAVICAPDNDDVAACVCRANVCQGACQGVTCEGGLVCNPRSQTGACVRDDCRGLGCDEGELCNMTTGGCEVDPCVDAGCTAAQACRGGECERSCADVDCDDGERCRAGECVTDYCADVDCETGDACVETNGECVTDFCAATSCPPGTECLLGETAAECVTDPCTGLHCPGDEVCVDGECADPSSLDAGPRDEDAGPNGFDGGDKESRVLAAGGGGCTCSAAGASDPRSGLGNLVMLGLALAAVRRRSRRVGGAR